MAFREPDETLDKIEMLAMQLETEIDNLAGYACSRGATRNVQWLMDEYDKVGRIYRKVRQITKGFDYI